MAETTRRLSPEQLQVGDVVGIGETPEDLRYALVVEKPQLSSDGTLQGVTVCYADLESYQIFQAGAPVFWRLPAATVRDVFIGVWGKANPADKETRESEDKHS